MCTVLYALSNSLGSNATVDDDRSIRAGVLSACMATAPELLTDTHGRVRILTLNRPSVRNALTAHLIREVREALAAADLDTAVDAVILTGADPAFCAGLDLRQLGSDGGNLVTDSATPVGHPWMPLTKPIIGAINGAAITGGLEFALACDFLVASERAQFADTHARVGVLPGWGLSVRLPEAVGLRYARRMSVTGNFVDAAEALRVGLVTQVVSHSELLSTALSLAVDIVGNEQSGVRAVLGEYRAVQAHVVDPGLAEEGRVSSQWMKGFRPGDVEQRRSTIVERGRGQS